MVFGRRGARNRQPAGLEAGRDEDWGEDRARW
jgi:hypothetical protein